jgi:hypothetical protein
MMELGTISSWVAIGITVLLALYTWYANSQRATKSEVGDHGNRLTKLESAVESLPNKDTFHRLELDVTEIKGTNRVHEEKLNAIGATTQRIEKWLLDNSEPKTTRKTR